MRDEARRDGCWISSYHIISYHPAPAARAHRDRSRVIRHRRRSTSSSSRDSDLTTTTIMGQGSSSNNTIPFPRTALHCLRVQEDSPAFDAGIQPFFDYLVGVELLRSTAGPGGQQIYEEPVGLSLEPDELARVLEEHEGREIGLQVYNSKVQRIRCESRRTPHQCGWAYN
jgi:hypothetical protein